MFTAPGVADLVDRAEPQRRNTEALVAPKYVGLCGTDLELFTGSMPYFASGDATYPVQPGHEVVGEVLECPEGINLTGSLVLIDPVVGCGDCGACSTGCATRCPDRRELGLRRGLRGGAAALISVPAANLYPLPAGLSPRAAVLGEPGVTVLNAVNRLGEVAGSKALIVGPGTLGLIALQLLMARGATVDICVESASRAAILHDMSARIVTEPSDQYYDVVLETAGTPGAVRTAINSVAPGGKIALTGVHGGLIEDFDVNRIVLGDVTVYGVLNGPGLYSPVLEELASGVIDASFLIDSEFDLSEYEGAIRRLRAPDRAKPKVLLRIGKE